MPHPLSELITARITDNTEPGARSTITNDEAREIREALDAMHTIVEKLPLTADGARMYPGIVVWFHDENVGVVDIQWNHLMPMDRETSSHRKSRLRAYSTPEAAKAATL